MQYSGRRSSLSGATSKNPPEPGVKGELFRACNGIYWSAEAEDYFGKGYFVIVPDLEVICTKAQARAWEESAVKEYRVRVMRPDAPAMQKGMGPGNRRTWYNIDGKKVVWSDPQRREKSTFRPRARYLYWTYLTAVWRNVHDQGTVKAKKGVDTPGAVTSIAQGQIRSKYWGSAGAYVKKNMLRGFLGFLEEVGHEYEEELMEAAMDPGSEDEPAELAVMTAIEDILSKDAEAEEVDDDDDDDDDDFE